MNWEVARGLRKAGERATWGMKWPQTSSGPGGTGKDPCWKLWRCEPHKTTPKLGRKDVMVSRNNRKEALRMKAP